MQKTLCVLSIVLAMTAATAAQNTVLININTDGLPTVFDSPNAGDISFQGPVESYVLSNGTVVTPITSPGDPLLGATYTLTGMYIGIDTVDCSDIVINALLTIEESLGNSIGFQVEMTATTINSEFDPAVALGTFPRAFRNFTSDNPTNPGTPLVVNTVGTPSAQLANFGAQVILNGFSSQMKLRGTNPAPARLQAQASFAPRPFEAFVNSSGNGDLYIGVANVKFFEIFNVFSMWLTQPLGTGLEGGITFDALSNMSFFAPLGSAPFHVLPDSRNCYCFDLGAGSLPSGITLQFISIQLNLATQEALGSSPMEVTP